METMLFLLNPQYFFKFSISTLLGSSKSKISNKHMVRSKMLNFKNYLLLGSFCRNQQYMSPDLN